MAHPRKQVVFILLSAADLGLTCWLLERSGGAVYEANPVARWWLACLGAFGLACFKALMVAVVLGLVLFIARSRPQAAGRVLGLGCAISGLVVLYSAALGQAALRGPEEQEAEWSRHLLTVNGKTQEIMRQREVFLAFLKGLREDLLAGRCTLAEAADQLAGTERGRDPAFLRPLAAYDQDRPAQELLAAFLIHDAVASLADDRLARQVAARLEREFELTYGSTAPRRHRMFIKGGEGQ